MRRSFLNLPVWAEFLALTFAVTAVSLTVGLLIRGLLGPADAGQAVGLMRQAPPARAASDKVTVERRFVPVVDVFRALPPESPESPETPKAGRQALSRVPQPATVMSFDGRPLRKVRDVKLKVTAYSPDERSCGIWADGVTASGYSVWTNGMKLVAADTKLLPFGTILTVPGYNGGEPVQVLDRGGKIKGHRLDVLYPTHEIAMEWGVQDLTVTVWEYAD